MKSKKVRAVGEWVEHSLRRMCGAMSQDVRVAVIVVATLLLAGLSIYFTVSGIYNFGKKEGLRIQIRHIELPDVERRLPGIPTDNDVELQNEPDYDHEGESE